MGHLNFPPFIGHLICFLAMTVEVLTEVVCGLVEKREGKLQGRESWDVQLALWCPECHHGTFLGAYYMAIDVLDRSHSGFFWP